MGRVLVNHPPPCSKPARQTLALIQVGRFCGRDCGAREIFADDVKSDCSSSNFGCASTFLTDMTILTERAHQHYTLTH
ncbi:hypothetical protein E1301_Tti017761 [Triplophysa tibetana]|uniref:Uncharacterized protein n=1 Tax=Triplophysa tibetana TaxID=1572043 RepID=A0A5A9N054_9TELE|nr:hypothetical protein E1301_Tti017761 [Triplophysa tibetana]